MHLTLTLFGSFAAKLNDKPVTQFRSVKAQALLAYLVYYAGRVYRRETLAGLLWPDQPQEIAGSNLRQTLTRLQKAIQNKVAEPAFLLITRDTVQFNPESAYDADVVHFGTSTCARHQQVVDGDCEQCVRYMQETAVLYTEDFLAHFYIPEAPAFDEWVRQIRENLHHAGLARFHWLAAWHERRGEYEQVLYYAHRQLDLEAWSEVAHRQIMRTLARQGRRTAALAQFKRCQAVLLTELGVQPAPETRALAEEIEAASEKRPFYLPPADSSFVGRREILAQLHQYLADDRKRLITVMGLGGIGKTRLVLEAAHHLVKDYLGPFRDGVFWVNLNGVPSQEALLTALMTALPYPFRGHTSPQDQLIKQLGDKEVLLILDNFEHLIEMAAPLLADLLGETACVKVVVTSRERLNLGQEWVLSVEGLSYPKANLLDLNLFKDEVDNYSALILFKTRAQQIVADFDWDEDEERLAAAIQICQLVEGMPLGIELAVAWVNMLACRDIAAELAARGQALDMLVMSRRLVKESHQSIRLVFDYSWQMLTEQEQKTLAGLSFFRGSFAYKAALAVVPTASLMVLSRLVDQSLVRRLPSQRLVLHELLRQFAAEQLADDERMAMVVAQAHAFYYSHLLAQLEPYWEDERIPTAVATIERDIQNIRLGWQWAAQQQALSLLAGYIISLYDYYAIKNLYQEGMLAFDTAMAYFEININEEEAGARAILARLITRQADFHYRMGFPHRAIQMLRQSIQLLLGSGDEAEAAFVHKLAGIIHYHLGAFETAQQFFERSLALGEGTPLSSLQANTYLKLGEINGVLGDYDTARTWLNQSFQAYTILGQTWGVAQSMRLLGEMAEALSDEAEAARYYERSLRLFEEINSPHGKALCFNCLGRLALKQGAWAEAEAYLRQSLVICREYESQAILTRVLNLLTAVAAAQTAYEAAQHYVREALATAVVSDALPLILETLYQIAVLRLHQQVLTSEIGTEVEQQPNNNVYQINPALPQLYGLLDFVAGHSATPYGTRNLAQKTSNELWLLLPPTVQQRVISGKAGVTVDTAVDALLPGVTPLPSLLLAGPH